MTTTRARAAASTPVASSRSRSSPVFLLLNAARSSRRRTRCPRRSVDGRHGADHGVLRPARSGPTSAAYADSHRTDLPLDVVGGGLRRHRRTLRDPPRLRRPRHRHRCGSPSSAARARRRPRRDAVGPGCPRHQHQRGARRPARSSPTAPTPRVRHPLYAAELLNVVGLCLGHAGPWPWVVLVALVVLAGDAGAPRGGAARRGAARLCGVPEPHPYARARTRPQQEVPVREFSAPLSTTIPTTGNLTDDVVTNAREAATHAVFSRRTPDGWIDVTAEQFHDEVARSPRASSPPASRRGPRRTAVEDPLRVDAVRLRHLVRRRRDGADLRDLVGRADRLDPPGLGRPCGRGRGPRPPRPGPRGAPGPATCAELQHVWSIEDNAVDVLDAPRLGHLRRPPRAAAYDRRPRSTSPR